MVDPIHEIRDPIHGLIRLTDQEVSIIDTPPFQRLRRIKQLALANLVYPGALHTRFEHSLGTLHIADRILNTLDLKEQLYDTDIEIVRLAALLHDIGHGPFSHVSEYLLDEYYQPQAGTAGIRDKIHEKLTVDIINYEPSISGNLSDDQREEVCQMIRGSNRRDMKRDIVSSNLDADKIDYLLRDTYYAGVKYGVIDSDMIIDSFTKFRSGGETYLAIKEAAIFAVEQLIIAKHHMTQQIYAHRVRVITDYMIVRGIKLAIEDGLHEIKNLYSYDGSAAFCQNYLEYNDDLVFHTILKSNLERPKSIFTRLHSRNIFKQVCRMPLTGKYVDSPIDLSRLMNLSSGAKKELEKRVAENLECESWEVIVEVKNVKNPAYQTPGVLDPEGVLVVDRRGREHSINDYDELSSAKLPSFDTLHVIAPYTWEVTKSEEIPNQKLRLEETVREIILDYVGGGS